MAAAGEGRKRASMRQQKATADIASNNRPTGGMAKADLRNHSFVASGCRISKITNSTSLLTNDEAEVRVVPASHKEHISDFLWKFI